MDMGKPTPPQIAEINKVQYLHYLKLLVMVGWLNGLQCVFFSQIFTIEKRQQHNNHGKYGGKEKWNTNETIERLSPKRGGFIHAFVLFVLRQSEKIHVIDSDFSKPTPWKIWHGAQKMEVWFFDDFPSQFGEF